MIDWFAVLTPILVLPIALLFCFVGCSLLFSAADRPVVTFDVNFYVENSVLIQSHLIEFKVLDSGIEIASSNTDNIEVIEPGLGNSASRVRHSFSSKAVKPGPATLTCRVINMTDPQNIELLVSGGEACEYEIESHGDYRMILNADVSPDGMTPNDEFDDCNPIQL